MPLFFVPKINGTRVLKVGNADLLDSHFPFSMHGQIGLAENAIAFKRIGSGFLSSGIAGDNGLGFKILDDESEDIL